MAPRKSASHRTWRNSGRVRVGVAVACGIAVGALTAGGRAWIMSPLWGWDAAAAVYIIWLFATVFQLDCHQTAKRASAEDPDRFTVDALMALASVVSLAAVAMALVESGRTEGAAKIILFITCFASVALSWTLVHMTFTLRYARHYYASPKGGVDFNSPEDPSYLDFAYLSFTVGMTFQVSDTNISKSIIRHTILRHALLSYLFGTCILATTINLVAGLSK